jgi:hypothetical protein
VGVVNLPVLVRKFRSTAADYTPTVAQRARIKHDRLQSATIATHFTHQCHRSPPITSDPRRSTAAKTVHVQGLLKMEPTGIA